jgi:hypothetical protein
MGVMYVIRLVAQSWK